MRLSIETYVFREHFGDNVAIKMIKEAGFDAFDYSMFWVTEKTDMLGDDYRERALALRKYADEIGIECNQAHAPFPFKANSSLDMSNEEYRSLIRAIEVASILGAKNIIIHARRVPNGEDFNEYNRIFYSSFIPYCEKFNICVSVENLYKKEVPVFGEPNELTEFINSINSKWINACVDVGHLGITGFQPENVIRRLNSKILKAVHIHDNDGISDQHLLPYAGKFNWDEITSALKAIKYNGDFTFEVTGFLKTQDAENLENALKFAEQTGRLLIDKIKNAV